MRVPSFKKILMERFPEQSDWIQPLIDPLNTFMLELVAGIHKRLTVTENMDGEIKTVTMAGSSEPIKLAWGQSQKPRLGIIGKISKVDGSAVSLSQAISLAWSYNQQGEVQIDDVVGLDDSLSNQYILEILFLVN